jgi:hypothetical protein
VLTAHLLVSGGYPPKPYNDGKATLNELGFKDGDALIVTISSSPSVVTSTPSKPTDSGNARTNMRQENTSGNVGENNNNAIEVDGGYLVVRVS